MKPPRPNPNKRTIPPRLASEPIPEDLERYANSARYIGSGEHKTAPWPDIAPAPRKDANRCPPEITPEQANLMLKAAIKVGNISEDFEDGFPKRIWYVGSRGVFAARLTDRADVKSGKPAGYKGWPESQENLPTKPRKPRSCDEI